MISVIIPTRNEEKVIADGIAALRVLTLPYEIIISDGASTDATVAIATQYANRVVEYRGEKRQTIAAGRNAGAREARGDFFVFLDADTRIPDPDAFFTRALSRFNANKNLVALTGIVRVYPAAETLADRLCFGLLNFNVRLLNNVIRKGEASGEFQMIRRGAFQKLGGFREDLVTREDGDMFLRLSRIGQTTCDPRLTVYHSGRRAHRIGWPRLLMTWGINTIWVMLFGKAFSKEWTPIR